MKDSNTNVLVKNSFECKLRAGTDQRTRSANVGRVGHGHENSGAEFFPFFFLLGIFFAISERLFHQLQTWIHLSWILLCFHSYTLTAGWLNQRIIGSGIRVRQVWCWICGPIRRLDLVLVEKFFEILLWILHSNLNTLKSSSITASTMGTIMAVVAVLEIHMDRNCVIFRINDLDNFPVLSIGQLTIVTNIKPAINLRKSQIRLSSSTALISFKGP